eukprot:TRINITY_DN9728_c0_g1_i1.p1 TRINITY_DN9728_c0_g1~~TRINITY_DN9728_c0_g1_i1.p1  ORF type:complete len:458 (+),score=91.24 TRINITY_DN9728_c0_g1_i1:196-1569(+)
MVQQTYWLSHLVHQTASRSYILPLPLKTGAFFFFSENVGTPNPMNYQLTGLLVLFVLVCLLSGFNYVTMLEVISEKIESQKHCEDSVLEVQKSNRECSTREASCKRKLKKLESDNDAQTVEDLQAEIDDLKKQLQKAKKKKASSKADSSAVAINTDSVEAMTHKYSPVIATDCLSYKHKDLEPLIAVIPERLPSWAAEYSSDDELKQESEAERRHSFDKIAKQGSWSRDNPSGTGSALGEATDRALLILERVVDHLYATNGNKRLKIVDIPCGDLTWMPSFLTKNGHKVDYTGIDIVKSLINKHNDNYEDDIHVSFIHRDIVKEGLPSKKFDLIFSRHMLQHLTTTDALTILKEFHKHAEKYGAAHLLTTTYPDWQAHVDLDPKSSTRVRKLNLQQPPISLPQPLCWAHDFSFSFLGLWELPFRDLPPTSKVDIELGSDEDGDGDGSEDSNEGSEET